MRPMTLLALLALGLSPLPAAAAGPEEDGAFAALAGPPLGAADLGQHRARGTAEETPQVPSLGTATFIGNKANGAASGDAAMSGSVNGNSGFTTVFQNTGNNVLLQNSTTVNITLR